MQEPLQQRIKALVEKGGPLFHGIKNKVSPFSQFVTLVHRMLLNGHRDIGVFWLRYFLYMGLALCLGTIYYGLDKTWADTTSRSGCIFFAISFLTFMAISGVTPVLSVVAHPSCPLQWPTAQMYMHGKHESNLFTYRRAVRAKTCVRCLSPTVRARELCAMPCRE